MGQYWKLVNIDRKETLLSAYGDVQLLALLMSRSLEQLLELIRNPKWIPFSKYTQSLQVSESNSTGSPLLGLPQEVIDMIVCNLTADEPESVIYLSLTCVYFLRQLGPIFQKVLAEDTAPWAGDRLIFVGDYADGLDLGGICTIDELRQFDENVEEYGDNPLYCMPEEQVMCTVDERARTKRRYLDGYDVRQAGYLEQRVRNKLTRDDLQLFHRLAAIAKRSQPSADEHHNAPVLRNLTARQYVRDDVIAESDYAYSLGEVVLVFTTWTRDGSGLMELELQGDWAGHRLDIATMADVSEEGWTDVSQLAVENLMTSTDGAGGETKSGKRAS
ncbi:hypothetical protein Daus18300_010284 [Diaporthe australafricana]|uniref:F-box domain-containing protein n=1 Tax=Diaporthe australafricana TaxID=127596 RepID=A0ABR3WAY8_9PEZI